MKKNKIEINLPVGLIEFINATEDYLKEIENIEIKEPEVSKIENYLKSLIKTKKQEIINELTNKVFGR